MRHKAFSKEALRNDLPYLGLLTLGALYFCHRMYGIFFPFEADVGQNLYYRLNHGLLLADHNPHQWYYASYMPFIGLNNPFILLCSGLVRVFLPFLDSVLQALLINMLTSVLCLVLTLVSFYYLFRYLNRSRLACSAAALLGSYTGFHMVGIREFDHFYQVSMFCVGPTLIAFDQICKSRRPYFWVAIAAFFIGLSLVGASNVPLFYYLPFFFLLPWLYFQQHRQLKRAFIHSAQQALGTGLGILGAGITLIPGIVFLSDTNRAELKFIEENTLPFKQVLYSTFLREWWLDFQFPYFHLDFYLGLPTIVLCTLGGIYLYQNRKNSPEWNPLAKLFLIILGAAIVILHYSDLPSWMQNPIAWFYTKISIRSPHRFFLLALIPLCYLMALGLDCGKPRNFLKVSLMGFVSLGVLLVFVLIPNWNKLMPDQHYAAFLSLGAGIIGTFCLVAYGITRKLLWPRLTVICLFFIFFFGPIQSTIFPSYYFLHQNDLRDPIEERLKWYNLLGFNWKYDQVIAKVKRRLVTVPSHLRAPITRKGRVLDRSDLYSKARNFFAPTSGHRFAFSNIPDPASPPRMRELSKILSPAILDMAGVCWEATRVELPNQKGPTIATLKRKQCFPEAYLVPSIYPLSDKKQTLTWMKKASTQDYLNYVAINCEEEKCESLPFTPNEKKLKPISPEFVKKRHQEPGIFEYATHYEKESLLFLSTSYRFDWTAKVNGREAKVLRANHAFMAVPLPPGENQIQIQLDKKVHRYASLVSGLTLLLVIGMMFHSRRAVTLKD